MSKIAFLPIAAAVALGAGISAAPAGAASVGGWDGGTACKVGGKPVRDCIRVLSPVFEASSWDDDGVTITRIACPVDRPVPWASRGAFDSKYRVTREPAFGLFSDFSADVVEVGWANGAGVVTIRTDLDNMKADVQLAIGCSSSST